MPANLSSSVASPCIKVCQLDARQVCTGCGRSLGEIAEWLEADDQHRRRIVETAQRRVAAMIQSRKQDAQQ